MPRNWKEEVVFTAIMAGLMVFVMTAYNVTMAQGFSNGLVLAILSGYPLGLLVAIILDMLVVGPIAKGLAFKYIINDYMRKKTEFPPRLPLIWGRPQRICPSPSVPWGAGVGQGLLIKRVIHPNDFAVIPKFVMYFLALLCGRQAWHALLSGFIH